MLEELMTGLATGIVKFEYAKKEGEVRVAFGTLNPDLIPPQYKPTDLQELVETTGNLLNNVAKALENPSLLQDSEPFQNSIDWVTEALTPFLPKPKKEATEKKETPYQFYYDFAAKGWRQFHKDQITKIF